jgi:hypothetical protein
MTRAFEQFFPEVEVQEERKSRASTSSRQETPIPMHRLNTGITDIVGMENGERPGGFVLVVDGAALLEVRFARCFDFSCTLISDALGVPRRRKQSSSAYPFAAV